MSVLPDRSLGKVEFSWQPELGGTRDKLAELEREVKKLGFLLVNEAP